MDRTALRPSRACGLLIVTVVAACASPPLETPTPHGEGQRMFNFRQNLKDKVDLLFMVDNSNSMDAMSRELRDCFSQFFEIFSELAKDGTYVDLHIGVVTSDYGAGATMAPGCQASPGGDLGLLKALGVAAPAGCAAPKGVPFIQYRFQGANNLPDGQDLVQTFTCMASVGTSGCGFEHSLESVHAALHNPANQGFVRDEALLVVVFLTNEDDSSAPPDSDVFDRSLTARYGFESSFRSTQFGIVCGEPPRLLPYGPSGPHLACRAAPNPGGAGPGRLYDVARYVDFFKNPAALGGAKEDPLDVILVGIDGPSDRVEVILSNPGTPGDRDYAPCAPLAESANPPCVPVLQHACRNPARPGFFGDPAVRLNQVISSVSQHDVSSICEDDYSAVLDRLAGLIVTGILPGCIPGKLPSDKSGAPIVDCVVEEITAHPDGTSTTIGIPACGDGARPCWRAEAKEACACGPTSCTGRSPDAMGITVERDGEAPAHTTARIACRTLVR